MKNIKERHGYLFLPRHLKLLRQVLGFSLFGFYVSLAMEAIWSRKNDNFGLVMGTQAEIAKKLKVNQTTISRKIERLEKLNKYLIIKHENSIRLGFFPLFLQDVASKIHSNDYADLHELYAAMHIINAELQEKNVNLQEDQIQNDHQRVYRSSNNNYSFRTDIDKSLEDAN